MEKCHEQYNTFENTCQALQYNIILVFHQSGGVDGFLKQLTDVIKLTWETISDK